MIPPVASSRILDAFAAARGKGVNPLAEFLAAYPEHAEDLVGYAHELELQKAHAGEGSITPDDEAWIEAQVEGMLAKRPAVVDPFARWQPSRFAEARKVLGVPSAVLTAFSDRLVNVATVPLPFLDRLTQLLGVGLPDVVAFLEAGPRLSADVAYKADAAPVAAAEKISFETILKHAGVPPERVSMLLEEDA